MTKRVILPAEADEKMMLAGMASADMMASATQGDATIACFEAMRDASPNAGRVSAGDFEAAVIAGTNKAAGFDVWQWMTDAAKDEKREGLRAALASLGLEVEG